MAQTSKLQQEDCQNFSYFWEVFGERTLEQKSLLMVEVLYKGYYGELVQECLDGVTFNVESTQSYRKIARGYFTIILCLMMGKGMGICCEKCV